MYGEFPIPTEIYGKSLTIGIVQWIYLRRCTGSLLIPSEIYGEYFILTEMYGEFTHTFVDVRGIYSNQGEFRWILLKKDHEYLQDVRGTKIIQVSYILLSLYSSHMIGVLWKYDVWKRYSLINLFIYLSVWLFVLIQIFLFNSNYE